MKKFKAWDMRPIEDWGAYMSDEAKAFVRAFKSYLKRSLPDCEVIGFKPNHYDTFGFIKKGARYIYVSYNLRDNHPTMANFYKAGCIGGVLYRTAKHDKDYTGGSNNFSSINDLIENINKLFERMERGLCA